MREHVKQRIVEQGVKALKEYGYPDVDNKNIMTDRIYSAFFVSMLKDSIGHGADAEVNDLIREVSSK